MKGLNYIFAFSDYVEAIINANSNGHSEDEREAIANGLKRIEDVCIPCYDPATGEAVESPTFAHLVRLYAEGDKRAFIEGVRDEASELIAKIDNFINPSNENTPQGKYLGFCLNYANWLFTEAEQAIKGLAVNKNQEKPEQKPTISLNTVPRICLLNGCNWTEGTKKQLFDDLVQAKVILKTDTGEDYKIFKAFIFGDDINETKGRLMVRSQKAICEFVQVLSDKLNKQDFRINKWRTVVSWVCSPKGTSYAYTSIRQRDKALYNEIEQAIDKAINPKSGK